MLRCLGILAIIVYSASAAGGLSAVAAPAATDSTVISDSLYAAHHPRLMFAPDELPALRSKLRDGGRDDDAYLYISWLAKYVYPDASFDVLLGFEEHPIPDFGLEAIPNLGLVGHLAQPSDHAALELGRRLTLYIAGNWDVDDDIFTSTLRLRALALGYDMFFGAATELERAVVRDEILAYIQYMLVKLQYTVWEYRPYLSNKTTMLASAIGLGAIALQGEASPERLENALARSKRLVDTWLEHQVDDEGAYREGVLYGAWSMRNLVYYFEARLRYDGTDRSLEPKLRKMERWLAYELDPLGGGKVNNIQACTSLDGPLSRHTTYLDWAQARWGSRLAAYVWDHAASAELGNDFEDQADKAATVMWGQGFQAQNPTQVLPKSVLWEKRGLYYYRSGWSDGAASDDVAFSFYSGRFEGGHQQEEQNQFTLTAYGSRFAMDHGPGGPAKESEAHNIVFVAGGGQHNAGSAIGTDGRIESYLLGGFGDLVVGDATRAYATYSPHNEADTPFQGADWSWGYEGANPVEQCRRTVLVIDHDGAGPYFLIVDEANKDGSEHVYEWRMHTAESNDVDISANPIRISSGQAVMDVHVVHPAVTEVATSVTPFDNQGDDPNSSLLSISTTSVDPRYVVLLHPRQLAREAPLVTTAVTDGNGGLVVDWSDGTRDLIILNLDENEISIPVSDWPETLAGLASSGPVIRTDARVAVLRFSCQSLERYLLVGATQLVVGATPYVEVHDGPVNITWMDDAIDLDRADASFALYGPEVSAVRFRGAPIPVTRVDGLLVPISVVSDAGAMPAPGSLRVVAYPNPFNPAVTVRLEIAKAGMVEAVIYDVAGRKVSTLQSGPWPAGVRTIRWDARNDAGRPVASGVYFLRVRSAAQTRTVKLSVVR